MSIFSLKDSLARAETRLKGSTRRMRSDRGQSRLSPTAQNTLALLLGGQEKPPMRQVLTAVGEACAAVNERSPSRAALYQHLLRAPVASYSVKSLPDVVRRTLYNLDGEAQVPGHQLAFHCFNYGDVTAMSFAAGLPWLALFQAARLRGHRNKSLGLLQSVLRARGI